MTIKIGDTTNWDESLRYQYPLNKNSVIVDCGACKGDFAEEAYRSWGSKIICFEPTEWAHEIKTPADVRNVAAWTRNGMINMGGDFFATSIYENTGLIRTFDCVEINEAVPGDIDLLKVNIEGGEFQLIPHIIKTGMIKRIKYLQVQFHIMNPQVPGTYEKIAEDLSHTHTLQWRYPFVWESWERK